MSKSQSIVINDHEFIFNKMGAFDIAKHMADMQKSVLKPIAEHFNLDASQDIVKQAKEADINVTGLIIGVSQAIDGDTLEHWTKIAVKSQKLAYAKEVNGTPLPIRSIEDLEVATKSDPAAIVEVIVRFYYFNFEPMVKQLASRFSSLAEARAAE